jgi:TPR repeat protein
MTNLGLLLQTGRGAPLDVVDVTRLHRQAAELGEPSAMNNFGSALAAGRGVEKNEDEAVEWFRRAYRHEAAESCVRDWAANALRALGREP